MPATCTGESTVAKPPMASRNTATSVLGSAQVVLPNTEPGMGLVFQFFSPGLVPQLASPPLPPGFQYRLVAACVVAQKVMAEMLAEMTNSDSRR